MSKWPNLSKAPIVEGLIDIRVERSAGVALASLKAACDEMAEAFPSRHERRMWMGQINLNPQESVTLSTRMDEPDGIVMRSVDDKWVVQFRLDGLTVSRLSPYVTWEELKSRTLELWACYEQAARPARIVRVASRFINRIPMPPGEPFERTFRTNFTLSADLPQGVAGYLLRLVIPFEVEHSTAIVTQVLDENGTDCILDLDAFEERQEGFSAAEAWAKLDVLREVKNRLFFGSLTAEAVERFK